MVDVVLFSGGWESTWCAVRATRPVLLYYDYGAPFQKDERRAAEKIAEALGYRIRWCKLPAMRSRAGVFPARNVRMLIHAAGLYPGATVWIGARGIDPYTDRYGDSNFMTLFGVSRSLGVRLRCPILRPKIMVKRGVPTMVRSLIYSTEDNHA